MGVGGGWLGLHSPDRAGIWGARRRGRGPVRRRGAEERGADGLSASGRPAARSGRVELSSRAPAKRREPYVSAGWAKLPGLARDAVTRLLRERVHVARVDREPDGRAALRRRPRGDPTDDLLRGQLLVVGQAGQRSV